MARARGGRAPAVSRARGRSVGRSGGRSYVSFHVYLFICISSYVSFHMYLFICGPCIFYFFICIFSTKGQRANFYNRLQFQPSCLHPVLGEEPRIIEDRRDYKTFRFKRAGYVFGGFPRSLLSLRSYLSNLLLVGIACPLRRS